MIWKFSAFRSGIFPSLPSALGCPRRVCTSATWVGTPPWLGSDLLGFARGTWRCFPSWSTITTERSLLAMSAGKERFMLKSPRCYVGFFYLLFLFLFFENFGIPGLYYQYLRIFMREGEDVQSLCFFFQFYVAVVFCSFFQYFLK